MGNIPPSAYVVTNNIEGVNISTRSEPTMGFGVVRELGIVFGNSGAYPNTDQAQGRTRLGEAFLMMAREAQRLGCNAVLSVHVEVKEYGQQYAVCQVYGTAVVVGPRM